jgi:hypothetical protein
MKFTSKCLAFGVVTLLPVFFGCSKQEADVTPVPAAQQPEVPQANNVPAQPAPAVQIGNVQQVNAHWDNVSKEITTQNYDNAVRAWVALDQAQRQAQMNDAMRAEYARRAYLAQEALRQKAETDARAREAYQALGRVMMGR